MVFIKGKPKAGGAIQKGKRLAYKDGYLIPVLTAQDLYEERQYRSVFTMISDLVKIPEEDFDNLYQAAINNFAEYVQVIPSQQNGILSGLLNEGLARAAITLKNFIEEEGERDDALHNYAVFTAALCLDLCKVVINQSIVIVDEESFYIDEWHPFAGSLCDYDAQYYKMYPIAPVYQRLETSINPLLARQILPEQGFLWIASDPEVFADWLDALNGDESQGGRVSRALAKVRRGDVEALLDKLMQMPVNMVAPEGTEHGEAFLTWLRDQIEEGEIKVNTADALVHVVEDGVLIERKLFIQYADIVSKVPISMNVVFTQFGNLLGVVKKGATDFLAAQYFSNYPETGAAKGATFASPISQPQSTKREGIVVRNVSLVFTNAAKFPATTPHLKAMQPKGIESHNLPKTTAPKAQVQQKLK